jgi:hypothetical protein
MVRYGFGLGGGAGDVGWLVMVGDDAIGVCER